jgi:hypothetical protein
MKPLVLLPVLPVLVLATAAHAQTPQSKTAKVEAEVILVGCAPVHMLCGYLMNRQEMAIKITKVGSGPFKVGDTPVVDVVTCFEGPLLRKQGAQEPFVELDPAQIRRGSKINLEFEAYLGGNLATTDHITVTKL